MTHRILLTMLCLAAADRATAQATAVATTDSAARADARARAVADTAQRLGRSIITVTRTPEAAKRAPWAVGVVEKSGVVGASATLGVDEALPAIPGVYIANRYNYALDQRLSIRGAGARANFGLRGVKVLLDGVPQSAPDGQSQLTNVDLAGVSRVEVLRGSASTLYGNGAGGVIAFTSDLSAPDALGQSARVSGWAFGMRKVQLRTSGRTDNVIGAFSLSRTTTDGTRQYSRADTRQLMAAVDWARDARTTVQFRVNAAATPEALNPGALTAAEYAANRDSAAAINRARGAQRSLSQTQFSVRMQRAGDNFTWSATTYVMRRLVDNPLATSPAGTIAANVGTVGSLGRWIEGVRLDGTWSPDGSASGRADLSAGASSVATVSWPRVTAGLDLQRADDRRRNWRGTAGRRTAPTDTLLLDQREVVASVGPFVLATWTPVRDLTWSAGGRYDQLAFDVHDHFFRDAAGASNGDNSGSRTMRAASGHAGVVWAWRSSFAPYANYATAFETPTTTELNSRADGAGGFNPDLGPQTTRTIEAGARGVVGGVVTYSVSLFRSNVNDAIIQYLETNGRAYFRNAGATRRDGLEIGAEARVARWLTASVAWTESDYRFVHYRVPNGARTDTLDGKREAGVPRRFVRTGLQAHWAGWTLDADHSTAGALFGDDRNTLPVADWGRGLVNVRFAWRGAVGGTQFHPFVAVNNLLDTPYVASVTINGSQGRVLEPAPLRNWYLGLDVAWRLVK